MGDCKNPVLNRNDGFHLQYGYLNLALKDRLILAQNLHFFHMQHALCKILYHFPLMKAKVLTETWGFYTYIIYIRTQKNFYPE